ncbi:hypothetical protein J6590_033964 [Homalodisca vitripennis]|nr:hypothetical protein J6590_033964 [Homalodisca vitripennis]
MFWLTRSVNLGNRVRDRNILRWIATNHCSSLNNSTFSIIKHHIFYAATNDLSAELFHHFHASTQEAMEEFVLFDFTKLPNLHGWSEMSDVVREVGMSKAVLVLQKTQRFQRGVLFTMLNPQPNGAGFAGFRTDTELDLSDYNTLRLHCRGQGENYGYKVVLRHKNENTEPFPSYEQMFQSLCSHKNVLSSFPGLPAEVTFVRLQFTFLLLQRLISGTVSLDSWNLESCSSKEIQRKSTTKKL